MSRFRIQAFGCAAMGLLCRCFGLLHDEATAPSSVWPGVPICHTGAVDWVSGFGAGLRMGAVMMLVSLAPLRWTGAFGLAGALTALLWVFGSGVVQALILAADQIAPRTGAIPSAVPGVLFLALSMASALMAAGRERGRSKHPAFRDGAHCFLRCGPMMVAMMLTGAMSLPWVIAGAVTTQIDEAIDDRRFSHLVTWCIGAAAAAFIAAMG